MPSVRASHFLPLNCVACVLACSLAASVALAQSAEDGFVSEAINDTQAVAVQDDGKVLVGGSFTSVGAVPRQNLARLETGGAVDMSFVPPGINGTVRAIAVQPDGKILIGGDFTEVGGEARGRIARLNADGSIDPGFSDVALDGSLTAMLLRPLGQILIAGSFQQAGVFVRQGLARLNPDGSVDPGFDAAASGVLALAAQADGKIWIGGSTVFVNGEFSQRIARLTAEGQLDLAFPAESITGSSTLVTTLLAQADGKLLLFGDFNFVLGQPRNHMARLNADGSLDSDFFSALPSSVSDAQLGDDDRWIVLSADGALRRILANGAIDQTFAECFCTTGPSSLARQADGKFITGGTGAVRRFDENGWPDNSLTAGANNFVYSAMPWVSSSVAIGGAFTEVAAQTRNRFARINPTGLSSVDLNANGDVGAFLMEPDGDLVVGGAFSFIGGATRNGLARFDPASATLDAGFNPDVAGTVHAIVRQPDGNLVIGGEFGSVGGAPNTEFLARLRADGSLDPDFDTGTGPNQRVLSLALEPDGSLLVAGEFSQVNGVPRPGLARLAPDGAVDEGFNPPLTNAAQTLLRQPDGRILVGGFISGGDHFGLVRLNTDGSIDDSFDADFSIQQFQVPTSMALQADGRIVVGGSFSSIGGTSGLSNIARLHADGSVDGSFASSANGFVQSVSLQDDGRTLLGGLFSQVGGLPRTNLARLSATTPAFDSLQAHPFPSGGTEVTWLRGGTSAELALPPVLQFSLGGVTYATIGTMERIAGGWRYQADDFAAPLDQPFFLRAQGASTGGRFNGSVSLVETIRQFRFGADEVLGDAVFRDGFEGG